MFTTLEEVRDYLAGDRIQCLICKKWFARLCFTHLQMHSVSSDEYRVQFGIPWSYSLTSAPSREATRRTITPEHLKNLKPRVGAPPTSNRKPPAVVRKYWLEHIVPMGPPTNARVYVTAPCDDCQTPVVTTLLCQSQGVHCKPCARVRDLANKRTYKQRRVA